jgi:hypothetical protein
MRTTWLAAPVVIVILLAVTWVVFRPRADVEAAAEETPMALASAHGSDQECAPSGAEEQLSLGAFQGKVSYDEEAQHYMVEFQGARLPFKSDPRRALEVPLEAPGEGVKEKNRALLYGLMGPDVKRLTLLVDPREQKEALTAAEDLERYISIVASEKFGGIAFSSEPGDAGESGAARPPVMSLDKATAASPVLVIRGPQGGATATRVKVQPGGRFLVEGATYDGLRSAADLVCLTIVKMLCGSADCPDAAACATGGACGC